MLKKPLKAAGIGLLIFASACATAGPRGRIEQRLVKVGVDASTAGCLASEMADKLDRRELNAVADFLDGLDRSDTPGQALDALLSIDDPSAAAGVARAGISCALEQITR
ncbi:MAG: hypothetical protein AAGJ73_00820 [Pseudomonadota bacterium]